VEGDDIEELDGEPGLSGAEEDFRVGDDGDVVGFWRGVGGGVEGERGEEV
jgi:hypothetical protein